MSDEETSGVNVGGGALIIQQYLQEIRIQNQRRLLAGENYYSKNITFVLVMVTLYTLSKGGGEVHLSNLGKKNISSM